MALKDDIKKQREEAQAKSGKSISLLDALSNAVTVFKEGLVTPNKFNAPAANRFKDSALGLIGTVPGLGIPAAAVQTADYTQRNEPVAAMLSALSAAVPALGAMMHTAGPSTSALKNKQSGAVFGISDDIIGEYPVQKGIYTALKKKAAAVGGDVTHPSVVLPDKDNGLSYFLGHDGTLRVNAPGKYIYTDDTSGIFRRLYDAGMFKTLSERILNVPELFHNDNVGTFVEVVPNKIQLKDQPKYTQNIHVSSADLKTFGIKEGSAVEHELSHALSNLFGGVRGGAPSAFTAEAIEALPADMRAAAKKSAIGLNSVTDEMTAGIFASQENLMPFLADLLSTSFKGEWKTIDGKQVWGSVQKDPKAFNRAVTSLLDKNQGVGSTGLRTLLNVQKEAHNMYKNLAGEVEARGAQAIHKAIYENKVPLDKVLETNPHAYMDTPLNEVIMQYTNPLIKEVY